MNCSVDSAKIYNNPWFSAGLKKSSKVKTKLCREYISASTPLNLATYKSYKINTFFSLEQSRKDFSVSSLKSERNIKAT